MKLYALTFVALFLCASASTLKAQIVNIPDFAFRNKLLNHGYSVFGTGIGIIDLNADGQIQVTEANSYSGVINVNYTNITDLTGLEAFINLHIFYCINTGISSLDVSANTQLTTLYCGYNNLTNLDVSNNPNLQYIICDNNSITSIDLTGSNVQSLSCKNNPISAITVNNGLNALYCDNTQITDLDLSSVGWSFYTFTCSNNNNLSQLNIANGNNSALYTFDATGNPNLSCINVSDENWCINNLTVADGEIDSNVTFSTNCFTSITETNNLPNLQAYPNPTQNTLTLDLGTIQPSISINISNAIGEKVQSTNYTNTQALDLNIEGLPGWYFIQIETKKGRETIKILKQ